MTEIYDLVIIGGGAAGLTAGIYAARDRCQALLLERLAAGGQVLNCEHIENYPGFPDGVAGYTLGPLLQQQAMQLGLGVRLAEVEAVRLEGELLVLQMGDGDVRTRVVERRRPVALRMREHRVEERRRMSGAAQVRGRVQRAERRVRLLRLPQLRVEAQVVGLAEQDVTHAVCSALSSSKSSYRAKRSSNALKTRWSCAAKCP